MSFKVVILSARASNLVPCVRAVLENEPDLAPEDILVVDDGARGEAESQLPSVRWIGGIKPFVYARNANIAIREAAPSGVILLNDDALLRTPRGFTRLHEQITDRPDIGICSASIAGLVGNPRQAPNGTAGLRIEHSTLAFVCVYISRAVLDRLGPLDERFTGYGFEDNDYCARAKAAGLKLAVFDGCIVDHSGVLPSTFRTRPDLHVIFEQNRRSYAAKWEKPQTTMHTQTVDLLYLACNRLEFTRETFTTLLNTTDWQHVNELFVYDDGSIDGTREWLDENAPKAPTRVRVVHTRFGSPVTAMSHFIESASAPILAKTDNDAMLPPGWMRQSLEVLDHHPELMLLGIEAMYPHSDDLSLARSYTPAEFISGLGFYRRAVFARSRPVQYQKWFGLEEWQVAHGPSLTRGWITPAIPVFLLDRFPHQPWTTWSDSYISRGWQRSWPKYPAESTLWRWRWPNSPEAAPAAPQLPPGDTRFLCAMRIKNEAAHIREVLDRVLPLCSRVFVFDDHSDDDTAAICRSYGDRVVVLPSPFQGLNEARDKNYLLAKIIDAAPEWVLWIDGDEVLESGGAEKLKRATEASTGIAALSLRIAYVWDRPDQVRIDGIFGQFRRASMFRIQGQPVHQLRFPESGSGPNFHCGNVPLGLAGVTRPCDVRLKHYGYMTPEQRRQKYTWYSSIDPNNASEDYYRHIGEIPGARFAPGPLQLVRWID